MKIKIPNQQKQFLQVGNSDVLGNIWSSFNLDLTENLGRIRVAPRGLLTGSSATLTNLTLPSEFKFYDNGSNERIWCLSGDRLFYNSGDPDDTWTEDATAGTPTGFSDDGGMELFNSALYVAGNGDLNKYDGTWTAVSTAPNGGVARMCVFQNRLYSSQSTSQIFSVSSADVVVEPTSVPNTNLYTLQLSPFGVGGSSGNIINAVRSASDRIWIGTTNTSANASQGHASGMRGRVFEWDGVSTQPTRYYELESMGCMAMIIKKDIPYIMDADGKLLKFNGSSFVEVARLPVNPSFYLRNPANSVQQRFIHPSGIAIKDEKILLLINGQNNDSTNSITENLPSGIWEFDEESGNFYHKYSVSISPTGFSTRTDYAQNRLAEVGALAVVKSTDDSDNNGDILFGAEYYTTATASAYGTFVNDTKDTKSKVGYFVTTKIDSEDVQDMWQRAFIKHKRLLDSSDKIVLKYRTTEVSAVEGTITWTSTTTFTSTLNLSSYAIGDEVEVTRGTGGGQIEHITAISENAGTYTVTLENAVTGATGTGRVRFQKWKRIGTIANQVADFATFDISEPGTWIQFKCVMYFTGKNEVNELAVVSKPHIPLA